jgi:hypothetical protein
MLATTVQPRWKSAAGLILLAALVGCSEPKFYPTRGEVMTGRGPLTAGEVRFRPVKRPDLVASGKIQKDGKFTLSTPGHGEGVLEGDCQAVVFAVDGGPRVASRFSDYDTADLNFTVTPRDENYFILELRASSP